MSVAKVIEIVSSSENSFNDAVQQGLAEAAKSLRGISVYLASSRFYGYE